MAKAYYFNPRVYNRANTPVLLRMFRATSGGTVYSSNLVNTSNNDLFTDTFAVNDALYFGTAVGTGQKTDGRKWRNLWFNASGGGGLNMAGTYAGTWEYYNGSWVSLTCTDNTSNFTTITASEKSVTFTPPIDWRPVSINSTNGFWIRYRLTSVTTATEGGKLSTYPHFGTNVLAWTGDTAGTDNVSLDDLYQWAEVSGPSAPLGIITPLDSARTTGHRAYKIDCYLSAGVNNVDTDSAGTALSAKAGYFNDKDIDLIFTPYCIYMPLHTSSITTMGNEFSANEIGNRGVRLHYNVINSSFRLDYEWHGATYLYGVDASVLENYSAFSTVLFNTLSNYISSASHASEYLNCNFAGFNFIDLGSSSSGYKKHIYFENCNQPQLGGGGTMSDINSINNRTNFGLFTLAADQTITNLNVVTGANLAVNIGSYGWQNQCDLINSSIPDIATSPSTSRWSIGAGENSNCKIRQRYTVDVNVQDKDGNAISGATVAIQPDTTAPIQTLEESNNFSVTTDASGNITQQTLTARKYTPLQSTLAVQANAGDTSITLADASAFPTGGTNYCYIGTGDPISYTTRSGNVLSGIPASGTYAVTSTGTVGTTVSLNNTALYFGERNYNPFKITISKPGYRTLTLRKVTIDKTNYALKGFRLQAQLVRTDALDLSGDFTVMIG